MAEGRKSKVGHWCGSVGEGEAWLKGGKARWGIGVGVGGKGGVIEWREGREGVLI